MGFFVFLFVNAALFVRPGEIISAFADVQIYLMFMIAALALSSRQLTHHLSFRMLLSQPVTMCMLGLVLATPLSFALTIYLKGMAEGLWEMSKVFCYYILLVANITSIRRMREFLLSTLICSTLMIGYSVLDFQAFKSEWSARKDLEEVREQDMAKGPNEPKTLRHIVDRYGRADTGEEIRIFRLCGMGIFHDPNDVSLLIVATGVIAFYFLNDLSLGRLRLLAWPVIGLMATALILTQSRGGLLASAAAVTAWLATRFGGRVAVTLGILGAAALPILLGRQADINISGGTGQQRIQLWADGLNSIKNAHVFFGIGKEMYTEVAGMWAHNSFVHTYVELGFFGGTMFLGTLLIPLVGIYRMRVGDEQCRSPQVVRMAPYIAALILGSSVGMLTLSRAYNPSTYMICGVGAAFINLVSRDIPSRRPLTGVTWTGFQRLLVSSAAMLAGFFVFVRIFARYG